jgi:ArsR family transcriptional regulator
MLFANFRALAVNIYLKYTFSWFFCQIILIIWWFALAVRMTFLYYWKRKINLKGRGMKIAVAVDALAALAQESRLSIFRLLVQAGKEGLAAGVLGEKLGIPPATLSFHLKGLAHARLVKSRTAGRYVIYTANYVEMDKLIAYLTEHCCAGDTAQCSPRKSC